MPWPGTKSGTHPPSHSPRPSTPTLLFFQLEMQGGIFQSCWSFTVSARGGECMTGTGGDPGPRGTLVCLNLGGSSGSTGMSCILMMRVVAPLACCGPVLEGVYFMYCAAPGWEGSVLGFSTAPLRSTMRDRASAVALAVAATSSSSGFWRFCSRSGDRRARVDSEGSQ